jgi:hypothetical protein
MKQQYLILKKLMIIFSIIAVFQSCDNPWFDIDPDRPDDGKFPPNKEYTTTGRLVYVTCGWSALNELWVLDDQNKYYQPVVLKNVNQIDVKEGDRVTVKYRLYNPASDPKTPENELIRCMAALPSHKDIVVLNITKDDSLQTDCLPINVVPMFCALTNPVHILNAAYSNQKLVLEIGYSGCEPLTQEDFKIEWNKQWNGQQVIKAAIQLVNKKPSECTAYFNSTICVDLSTIKASIGNQPFLLNVGDESVLIQD